MAFELSSTDRVRVVVGALIKCLKNTGNGHVGAKLASGFCCDASQRNHNRKYVAKP